MHKYKYISFILVFITLFFILSAVSFAQGIITFNHLDTLEFEFTAGGRKVRSWAIYAEPVDRDDLSKGYVQVEAPGEGYGCVDDVARVALIYLDHYKKTQDPVSLEKAEGALEFVLYMEDGDGGFYNFVDKNGVINKTGHTSKTGLDWWTARGFRAAANGALMLKKVNPDLSSRLKKSAVRTKERLHKFRNKPNVSGEILPVYKERHIEPGTLVHDSGAITSIFTLGLLDLYELEPDETTEKLIKDFSNGMCRMRERNPWRFPFYGLHYPTVWNTDMVHFYGNRQVQALARAGAVFETPAWIKSAETECTAAYPFILTLDGVPFALSPEPEKYPQISYSVETIITNLVETYKVTGREKYRVLAQYFAAWYFGSNPAKQPLWLPGPGVCLDGIDKNGVNTNAGAESTIEALLAFQSMGIDEKNGVMDMKPGAPGLPCISPVIINAAGFETNSGETEREIVKLTGGADAEMLILHPKSELSVRAPIEPGAEYTVYIAYKILPGSSSSDVEAITGICGRYYGMKLEKSRFDYQFKTAPVGWLNSWEYDFAEITVKNENTYNPVAVRSVILVPRLIKKSWSGSENFSTLVFSTGDEPVQAEMDFETAGRLSGGGITGSSDSYSVALEKYEWFIISTMQLSKKTFFTKGISHDK